MRDWEGSLVPPGQPIDDIVPGVGPEIERLRRDVERFARRRRDNRTGAEIGEQLRHLGVSIDILRREQAALAALFAKTGEAERQASISDLHWLRHNVKLSAADASALMVVGRHLDELDYTSVAMTRGTVGFGHLVEMARNAEFCERSEVATFDELALLANAREESVGRFHFTCMSARHAQDPEKVARSEANDVEYRELTINPKDDGTTWFNVRLDNAEASIARSVLEGLAVKLGPDDHRYAPRRMADAFVEVIHLALKEEGGGKRITIAVTCTDQTLLGLRGAPAAELDYGMVSSRVVERLACNATITKILLDEKLIPVAVGHTKRHLTRAQRKALNARDGHCRWPGCSRPPRHCDEHHVRWYSVYGTTDLEECILLCSHHHWRVHEGGWRLSLSKDREVVVTAPHMTFLARGPGTPAAA